MKYPETHNENVCNVKGLVLAMLPMFRRLLLYRPDEDEEKRVISNLYISSSFFYNYRHISKDFITQNTNSSSLVGI